jgi:hypothetical protein
MLAGDAVRWRAGRYSRDRGPNDTPQVRLVSRGLTKRSKRSQGELEQFAAPDPENKEGEDLDKLVFSPENSLRLGLADDEPVRVLASGSKTILLERVGAEAIDALPWDRDLVLTADVASFALADILHLLHASSKSGFLFFENGEHTKSVYLHRGEVVFATSNQPYDRLGECLLRSGVLTPEQLDEAVRAYRPPAQFGRVLIERGVLSSRELWAGVKLQVEEIVRSLFSYGAGAVLFWEGEIRPDNVVRLSLPTRRLIAEGLRRRDELMKFLAWLEAPRVRVNPIEGAEKKLSGTERAMFDAVSAASTFAAQCRLAGVEPLCGARTVSHLRLLDAVVVTSADAEHASEGVATSDEDVVRECCLSHVKLLAEFAAPIVAVEGDAGLVDRFGRVVQEASRRYPELLNDLVVSRGAVLDPEEVTRRAMRYPGDREREVRLALGELCSYLEFELVNHPRIPDSDEFLVGLNEFRESI